jgi:hypothetical protein
MRSALSLFEGSPLAAHVWRGSEVAQEAATVPTGHRELDLRLPGGGWPQGALTEILLAREGIGELRLALPALAHLTQQGHFAVLVDPPYLPYAPALLTARVVLSHLLIVRTRTLADRLWTFEQALRARECGAAFAWLASQDERVLRRLQIAAREGGTWGVLWRRPGQLATTPTAALRLKLTPHAARMQVEILKRRGGQVAHPFSLAIDHAVGMPALPGAAGRNLHARLAEG